MAAADAPCRRCLLAAGLDAAESAKLVPGFLDNLPLPPEATPTIGCYKLLEKLAEGGFEAVLCLTASKWAPDLREVRLARSRGYAETGPSADALEFVRKSVERFPQQPVIWECQGKLLAATNRWQEAVAAYSKALELTVGETNGISALRKSVFQGRAEAYRGCGETNKALADLISCREELDPILRNATAKP